MRIGIASIGRFHVLDLARELDHLGIDTRFYSYVPRNRAARFGLPARCHRALLPLVAPLVGWQRYAGNVMPGLQERAMAHALDAAVMARLEPCDVFICMSGMYLEAARHARRRFGACIWLERGSRHILSQRAILGQIGAERTPSDFIVRRELDGYALADRIVVPARQVAESFAEQDPRLVPKLIVNPYGVDLAQFPPRTSVPPPQPATVLFVGAWSRRKGADILVDAIRRLDGVRLLHVGSITDVAFPHHDPRFEHVDPVPQWQLAGYYARAHVFALASREEGLALVQVQALASGLPLVCTSMTGGADLAHSSELSRRIVVTPPGDATAFADGLASALDAATGSAGMPPLPEADRDLLGWQAYGRRYHVALVRDLNSKLHSLRSA